MNLVESIHRGLYDSWLFVFETTDTPFSAVRPEYLATTFVAERLRRNLIENNRQMQLVLEDRVSNVATACFSFPPFPRRARRVPCRKAGKKSEREKVDICVYESGAAMMPVARHVIELKISNATVGLREDLLRNMRLMELVDSRTPNMLNSAHLALILPNDNAFDDEEARAFEAKMKRRFEEILRNEFVSIAFTSTVDVQTAASPPNDEELVGEFRHMISVVISFVRAPAQFSKGGG